MALGRVLPPDPSQFVQRSGDAMSGDLTFSAGATAVVPDPVDPTDAVNLRTLEASLGPSQVITHWEFSAGRVGTTTTGRFLIAGGSEEGLALTTAYPKRVPRGGTARRLVVTHGEPAGNGRTIRYTLRVNRANTGLSVDIASSGVSAFNFVTSVSVADNDEIDVVVTKPDGIIGTSPRRVMAALEIAS